MPEVWRKTEPHFQIIVWQSTEPISVLLETARLSDSEVSEYSSFRSETRKREWITVRTALRHLFPDSGLNIVYNSNGKPQLVDDRAISISHSGEFIAIIVSENGRVGIDIEQLHPRIEVLSKKFVNDMENAFISSNRIENLHIIWGAKEVLFKIHSHGGLDFRNDLLVNAFTFSNEGECNALIKKKNFEESFVVYYKILGKFVIVYARENDK